MVDGNLMFGTVGHEFFTGIQVPLTPGCNDLDAGCQCIGSQFKTYLVISFTGGSVGDGIGAGFIGNFNQLFGNQRAGNGSSFTPSASAFALAGSTSLPWPRSAV